MGIAGIKLGPKSRRCSLCGGEHDADYHLDAAPLPERAVREGDQPLPVDGIGESVHVELANKVLARGELGLKRYGKKLQAFNGRDPFRDAEEELLDQYAYLTAAARQHLAVVQALQVLAKFIRARERVGGHGGAPATVRAALELAQKLEACR